MLVHAATAPGVLLHRLDRCPDPLPGSAAWTGCLDPLPRELWAPSPHTARTAATSRP
ncbi:hypothetical protein ACGFYV_06675 [Streptomyces sp. NPDC048297]|uniref:hypothetical protein n=1 Tax=Streptomyces sp. NPDC048297 TaxID=3365531 RepID=UPI003713A252